MNQCQSSHVQMRLRDDEGSRHSGYMQCTNRFSSNLQPSRAELRRQAGW